MASILALKRKALAKANNTQNANPATKEMSMSNVVIPGVYQ
jgi:hypothetical protein